MQVLSGTVETNCLAGLEFALQAALYPGNACFHPATGPGGSTGQRSPRTAALGMGQCSTLSSMQVHPEKVQPFDLAAVVFAPGAVQSPGNA